MFDADVRSPRQPKVFISYARADSSALAEELVPGLKLAGFDPYLDKHDIEKGVDWEQRLGSLIRLDDPVTAMLLALALPARHWTITWHRWVRRCPDPISPDGNICVAGKIN